MDAEWELLRSWQAGDEDAGRELVAAHFPAISRFFRAKIGDDVEDLVQCTFVEAWRSASRYRKKGRVLSWLFGIAANLARHHLRTQARRERAMERLASTPSGASSRPDDAAETQQLIELLRLALEELPHHLRVAFVLCDLEQISGVEAARALGIREGTMWRRLHQARKAIRESIDERSSDRRASDGGAR